MTKSPHAQAERPGEAEIATALAALLSEGIPAADVHLTYQAARIQGRQHRQVRAVVARPRAVCPHAARGARV